MNAQRARDNLDRTPRKVLEAVESLWPDARDGLRGGISPSVIADRAGLTRSTTNEHCRELLRRGLLRAAWGCSDSQPRLGYAPRDVGIQNPITSLDPRDGDRCETCGNLITVGTNGTEYGHQRGKRRGSDSCPQRPDDDELEVVA
jgi:hypothetical protein